MCVVYNQASRIATVFSLERRGQAVPLYTAAHKVGAFYLLAQKLVNSDLNKSTTICKVGDLEVSPKAFLDLETYTRS